MIRAVLLAVSVTAASFVAVPAAARPSAGDIAPHYRIRMLDDREVDSSTLRGQVVIISRWATWCAPCKQELPVLDAYYRAHAEQGLRVFAVTTADTASDATLQAYAAPLAFPIARSLRGGLPELTGVPTNYVIDRAGIIRYARTDAFDAAQLDAVVAPLLREPAAAAAK